MLAIFTAIAIFGLMSLPGWILATRSSHPIWVYVAAGFCSQFLIILIAAVSAILLPGQLDIRAAMLIAPLLSVVALFHLRGGGVTLPARLSPWTLLVPVLATLVAALITLSAISIDADGLTVRAWFNADGFKHLGHVHALANFGLPARDIFSAGTPLAYYWFFYVIPGLGASLHGDAVRALVASNLVQTFAFWIVVHGLLRTAGASERWATALALIGWLSPSPDGLMALAENQWNITASMANVNVEGVNGLFLDAFTLFRLSLYIPQHQFMLAGLISWATLAILPRGTATRGLRVLSVLPLICAGAVSTLFGIACLGTFAMTRLLDGRIPVLRRLVGIVAIGVLALVVPLGLGVVDLDGGSGLDSPIFASAVAVASPFVRFLMVVPGIVLAFGVSLLGLIGLQAGLVRRDLPEEGRIVLIFATALVAVGLGVSFAATLLSPRMTLEIQLRATLLPYLGLTIGSVWLLTRRNGQQRLQGKLVAVGLPLLAVGLLTPVHDLVWHHWSAARWTVQVPPDDMTVLSYIAEEVPVEAIVLQYPELPFVSGGRDIWAPVLAGRMAYASDRSTQWRNQIERLQQATDFFSGTGQVPEGSFDHIYLSRTLHPETYNSLMTRMSNEADWTRGLCLPDACLWHRN